jgi:hypothetical protein
MRTHPRTSILVCLFVLALITTANSTSAQQVRIVHINVGQAGAGGDTASNWANNNGVIKNGTNSGGGAINGTPRAKNSVTP